MAARSHKWMILLALAVTLTRATSRAQEAAPPVPQGLQVLTRGPVHEAFANMGGEATPTDIVPKTPPKPLDEMPPEDKPEGDVIWISGYWAWDDDRKDFLWVSGTWRSPPPGRQWVAGYWKPTDQGSQWVAGFWTAAPKEEAPKEISYLPQPPAPPVIAPPGKPPTEQSFYVPGSWVWAGDHYACAQAIGPRLRKVTFGSPAIIAGRRAGTFTSTAIGTWPSSAAVCSILRST